MGRGDLESQRTRTSVAGEDGGAAPTLLDDDDPRELGHPLDRVPAEECLGLALGREQDVGMDAPDELASGSPTVGQEGTDRRKVDRYEGEARSGHLDGSSAGLSERLAEQRIGRHMEEVETIEPAVLEIARPKPIGRSPVGHEGPFAAGADENADATGPLADYTTGPDDDPVGAHVLDERTARPVAADRADELRPDPQSGKPSGGIGGRASRPDANLSGDVGARFDRPVGCQHDVEDEVPDHHDARRASGRPTRRAGHARRVPALQSARSHEQPGRVRPMTVHAETLDRLAIDTIRTLSMDAVQKANSGHPGAPMGAAPMAYVLWTRHLRHAPTQPDWPDRDRFVLSAGHASMLLYSLLHLTGYDLPLSELERFRQWGSRTPGHPEYGLTSGVEATTGPLGQGFANAVGMAIAEHRLGAEFNRDGHTIVDHRTYGICSDGDLQEGIASEAASLAGHLRLGKLIFLYDDNHIQLDGPTSWAWSEDVGGRFDAYGWHTQRVDDGNDIDAIDAAIGAARSDQRPSLIAVRTHIGYGSPNRQDSQKAHGQPLGEEEVRLTKQAYGWDPDRTFYIPDEVEAVFSRAIPYGEALHSDWELRFANYERDHRELARELSRRLDGSLRADWDVGLPTYAVGQDFATRQASQAAIAALAEPVPELFGGAADLSESNLTDVKGAGDFSAAEAGRNIRFGVREHAMGGVANGIAYHGAFIPYAGTFLNFSDYMRGSVRLAALSGLHVIYVWTHDSIGLGEDGPTHQPVEHYAALRAIPNLWFVRPGDANEATAAWALAIERRRGGPVALAFTRQKLPTLPGTAELASDGVRRGGYVIRPASTEALGGEPALILIGTGSELHLAYEAATILETWDIPTRVVSLPCWERFETQDDAYRETVLPANVRKRVSVEAGVHLGWERWVGDEGAIIGLDRFGASAPAATIFAELGFTIDRVAEIGRRVVRDGLHGRIAPPQGH